jgi:hypothetical protein
MDAETRYIAAIVRFPSGAEAAELRVDADANRRLARPSEPIAAKRWTAATESYRAAFVPRV